MMKLKKNDVVYSLKWNAMGIVINDYGDWAHIMLGEEPGLSGGFLNQEHQEEHGIVKIGIL